jgi:phosphatidylglycerophosphate synthase
MTLANKLTMLRIALIPAVMACLAVPTRGWNLAAALFFGAAAITDYFDGHLSRARNETSRLGKLLDPMADKLLIAAVFIALVLGIVIGAGEFASGTITQTFLAVPRRERVIAAKAVTAAVYGIGIGLFVELLTVGISLLWLSAKGVDVNLWQHRLVAEYAGALAASALAGPLGVGLGALLRRQTAALVIALVWLLVAEGVVGAAANLARYSPGRAFAAVVSAQTHAHGGLLGVWAGLAVVLIYVAALLSAGTVAVLRSDVG